MKYIINGFTEIILDKKSFKKFIKNKSVIELLKKILYLELNKNDSTITEGTLYIIYKDKNELKSRITTITFDKAYNKEKIIKNKKKISDFVLLKQGDINYDLNNSSEKPYGIFKF